LLRGSEWADEFEWLRHARLSGIRSEAGREFPANDKGLPADPEETKSGCELDVPNREHTAREVFSREQIGRLVKGGCRRQLELPVFVVGPDGLGDKEVRVFIGHLTLLYASSFVKGRWYTHCIG